METNVSPYDILDKCIHCGMCLPVCPTYALTSSETSSPRGRIRLMKYVAEDNLPLSDAFVDEMYFCLDCQACATICPAGVQYGALVERAREHIASEGRDPLTLRVLKKFVLNVFFVSRARLRWLGRCARWYERSGLREAIDRSNILTLFSQSLADRHAMLPRFQASDFDESIPEILAPSGSRKGRVGFLTGCIMNAVLPEVHRDVVEVLHAYGFEVVIPKAQECCGSLHGHNGEIETAKMLARRNLDVFERYSFDAFIVDSAGCGAFLKKYGELLKDDREYAERAWKFSSQVRDITEFLVDYPPPEMVPLQRRVTYHEACHLVHAQKVSEQPRNLIKSIPGVEFVELPEATWCCGSAGIYNIVRFEDSMRLLERKIQHLASTGAELVLTANPGCHLQLQFGIRKFGLEMEVMHPVNLLKDALP